MGETGFFCEHKRLRTSCATCRPSPPPAPPATHADEAPARRTARRVKAPTRAEAEQAEAWWVRK